MPNKEGLPQVLLPLLLEELLSLLLLTVPPPAWKSFTTGGLGANTHQKSDLPSPLAVNCHRMLSSQ